MGRTIQEDGGIVCDHFIDEPIVMYSTGKIDYTQEAEIFIGTINDSKMDELLIKDIEEHFSGKPSFVNKNHWNLLLDKLK